MYYILNIVFTFSKLQQKYKNIMRIKILGIKKRLFLRKGSCIDSPHACETSLYPVNILLPLYFKIITNENDTK